MRLATVVYYVKGGPISLLLTQMGGRQYGLYQQGGHKK